MWAKENCSVQVGGEEDTWDLLLTGMLQDQRQEEKYRPLPMFIPLSLLPRLVVNHLSLVNNFILILLIVLIIFQN